MLRFKAIIAICLMLGKGNNKITDQYSAYEKGLVLYYFAYLIRLFGYYFLASRCILAGIFMVLGSFVWCLVFP